MKAVTSRRLKGKQRLTDNEKELMQTRTSLILYIHILHNNYSIVKCKKFRSQNGIAYRAPLNFFARKMESRIGPPSIFHLTTAKQLYRINLVKNGKIIFLACRLVLVATCKMLLLFFFIFYLTTVKQHCKTAI